MQKYANHIAAFVFFIGGILLIGNTFYGRSNAAPSAPYEMFWSQVDNFHEIAERFWPGDESDIHIAEADIIAIFVVTVRACPPCISNIFEYYRLLGNMSHDSLKIVTIGLVLDSDSASVTRFQRITHFPLQLGIAHSTELPTDLTTLYGRKSSQHLIFTTGTGIMFFKTSLPSRLVIAEDNKLRLLDQMHLHYHSQLTSPSINKKGGKYESNDL